MTATATETLGQGGDQQPERPDVFISYAREDQAIVERLAGALRASGRTVWVDRDDIRGTEEWARAVDAGIAASDAVAFVLSPPFLASEQCRRELEYSVRNGKRLVPLLAHAVDPAAVAPELARLNWITIADTDPRGVAALEDALDTDLDWVRAHTDLLVRAVAWEARNEDRGLLLRGRPLSEAERFLGGAAGKEPPPSPLHTRYVLAGRRAATRRQRATIAVVMAFLVVALVLAVVAFVQRNRAIHQSNLATSRALAGSSLAVSNSDPDLARLLAIAAMEKAQTPEAVAALRQAVARPALAVRARAGTDVVGLSRNGQRAALLEPGRTLLIHDLASGHRVASRPASAVRSLSFASGGGRLAFTTDSGDVVIWDFERGPSLRVRGFTAALAFSRDGSELLLVGDGGAVGIVDARSGRRRATLPAGAGESGTFPGRPTAAFSPGADVVVTWNENVSEARIWSARTGALRATLRHGANLTAADVSPDGKLAMTVGRDMAVRFWDPQTGARRGPVIAVPPADDDAFGVAVADASFPPERSSVVTTLTQDHVQVWRTRDGKQLLNMSNPFNYTVDQGFGPAVPYLLTGAGVLDWVHNRAVIEPPTGVDLLQRDGSFESVTRLGDGSSRIWSGETESTLIEFPRTASDVSTASGRVAVGYTDGTAEVRQAKTGRVVLRVPRTRREHVAVELSPDGGTLAVGRDTAVQLWRVRSGERRRLDPSVTTAIEFSADASRLLLFASEGAGVYEVLDTRTGEHVGKTFPPRTTLIESTTLSRDGHLFVQPTVDNTVDIFRVADGQRVGRLRGHTNTVQDVAVSPDNTLVASGGFDGLAIVWELHSGRRVATIRAHEAAVTHVGFSPDGRWLLTRSTDGTLRVWEARTGAPVQTWADLPAGLPTAAEVDVPPRPDLGLGFSAASNELLRADDGYVYRLPCAACAQPEQILARARREAHRPLTPAQRREYVQGGG